MKWGFFSWLKHVGYTVLRYQLEVWIKPCRCFDHYAVCSWCGVQPKELRISIMCYPSPKEDCTITVKTSAGISFTFRLVSDNCVSHNPAALPYYRLFNIQFHVSSPIKTAITHCYSYTAQQGSTIQDDYSPPSYTRFLPNARIIFTPNIRHSNICQGKIFIQVYFNPDEFPVSVISSIWIKYSSHLTGSNTNHLLQNGGEEMSCQRWYFLPCDSSFFYMYACSHSKRLLLLAVLLSGSTMVFSAFKSSPDCNCNLCIRVATTAGNSPYGRLIIIHLRSNASFENLIIHHFRQLSSFQLYWPQMMNIRCTKGDDYFEWKWYTVREIRRHYLYCY